MAPRTSWSLNTLQEQTIIEKSGSSGGESRTMAVSTAASLRQIKTDKSKTIAL